MSIHKYFRRIAVTTFCAVAALTTAYLGVWTMDRPEFANISHVCFFNSAVMILCALADLLEN